MLTEYNNQNDPDNFYSIGAEQQVSTQPSNVEYFNYYKVITLDHTQVSGTGSHLNFPLLISLLDEDLHDVDIIGMDETSIAKGHDYITLFVDLQEKRTIHPDSNKSL